MTVLVVEDDHGLRDVLARGLREHGYVVITAADGAGAMSSANRLARSCGGDISLQDCPEGAAFSVVLPAG
jgi:DNA-binding response OmpR family regulator